MRRLTFISGAKENAPEWTSPIEDWYNVSPTIESGTLMIGAVAYPATAVVHHYDSGHCFIRNIVFRMEDGQVVPLSFSESGNSWIGPFWVFQCEIQYLSE